MCFAKYSFHLTSSWVLLVFFLFYSSDIIAQDEEYQIEINKVKESLYMLTGKGGNIGISIGKDGVFMIDGQYADMSDKIKKAISELSPDQVKYLINTHWHGDHTGGNLNFSKDGAVIVAHENVKKRMSTDQLMKAFSRTVPASAEEAWPVITFSDDISFKLNGDDIFIFHVHNAHTDGDAMVYFMSQNVLHTGDAYFQGRYPFIDLGSGGSIDGYIKSLDKALFLIDEETVIIPGHGSLSSKKEMTAYRDILMAIRDRVSLAISKGTSLEDIKAANVSAEWDATHGTGFIKPEKLVDFIWTSLSEQ